MFSQIHRYSCYTQTILKINARQMFIDYREFQAFLFHNCGYCVGDIDLFFGCRVLNEENRLVTSI